MTAYETTGRTRWRAVDRTTMVRTNSSHDEWPFVPRWLIPIQVLEKYSALNGISLETGPYTDEQLQQIIKRHRKLSKASFEKLVEKYYTNLVKAIIGPGRSWLNRQFDSHSRALAKNDHEISLAREQRDWHRYLENSRTINLKEKVLETTDQATFLGVAPLPGSSDVSALKFVTAPVLYDDSGRKFYFGRALIYLPIAHSKDARIYPFSVNFGYPMPDNRVPFPHVRNHRMCLGDTREDYFSATREWNVHGMLDILLRGLHAFSEHPYGHPQSIYRSDSMFTYLRGEHRRMRRGSVAHYLIRGFESRPVEEYNPIAFAAFEADLKGIDILGCNIDRIRAALSENANPDYARIRGSRPLGLPEAVNIESCSFPEVRTHQSVPEHHVVEPGIYAGWSFHDEVVSGRGILCPSKDEVREDLHRLFSRDDLFCLVRKSTLEEGNPGIAVIFNDLVMEARNINHILGVVFDLQGYLPLVWVISNFKTDSSEGQNRTIHPSTLMQHLMWGRWDVWMQAAQEYRHGNINDFVNMIRDRLTCYSPEDSLYSMSCFDNLLRHRMQYPPHEIPVEELFRPFVRSPQPNPEEDHLGSMVTGRSGESSSPHLQNTSISPSQLGPIIPIANRMNANGDIIPIEPSDQDRLIAQWHRFFRENAIYPVTVARQEPQAHYGRSPVERAFHEAAARQNMDRALREIADRYAGEAAHPATQAAIQAEIAALASDYRTRTGENPPRVVFRDTNAPLRGEMAEMVILDEANLVLPGDAHNERISNEGPSEQAEGERDADEGTGQQPQVRNP